MEETGNVGNRERSNLTLIEYPSFASVLCWWMMVPPPPPTPLCIATYMVTLASSSYQQQLATAWAGMGSVLFDLLVQLVLRRVQCVHFI